MSLWSALVGGGSNNTKTRAVDRATATLGENATADRNRFLQTLGGGQEALNTSTRAAVSQAMPEFDAKLQGVRESAIRRGISTGDLATSYEGDLASAFQKNIANATASQATNIWNTQVGSYGQMAQNEGNQYLSALGGAADRAQAADNASLNFWGSLAGAAGMAFGGR